MSAGTDSDAKQKLQECLASDKTKQEKIDSLQSEILTLKASNSLQSQTIADLQQKLEKSNKELDQLKNSMQ